MTQEIEQITEKNWFNVNVEKLALDSRFGSLKFEKANPKLSKIQAWLKEVSDLGYKELLIEGDANQINRFIAQLTEYLEWLRKFDIGTVVNAKQEHDGFEVRIDKFYSSAYQDVVMRYLPFLREERRRENPDTRKLDEEVRKASQIRGELEKELQGVRSDIEKIKTTGKDVASARGERGAVKMAVHFHEEARLYGDAARRWLWAVCIGYISVIATLIPLVIFTVSSVSQFILAPESIDRSVALSSVISKLVFVAVLWYGLSFIRKNYNVNSHLAAVNRHRAAVAKTLEDFIAIERQEDQPRVSEMLQNAAEAMFKNAPIGFVSKTEKEGSNPVLQILRDLINTKNS